MGHKRNPGISSTLLTLGIGAGLMYLFDPQQGTRRRALLRDKMVGIQHDAERMVGHRAEDVVNRARGLAVEAVGNLKAGEVDDTTLAARVKTELGRHVVTNPSAIEVSAFNGTVTLRGPVLADEVQQILRQARSVKGVKQVINQLVSHSQPGNQPDLQTDMGTPTTAAKSGTVEKKGPATRRS